MQNTVKRVFTKPHICGMTDKLMYVNETNSPIVENISERKCTTTVFMFLLGNWVK